MVSRQTKPKKELLNSPTLSFKRHACFTDNVMSSVAVFHVIAKYHTFIEGLLGCRVLGVFIGNMVSAFLGEKILKK